jgi:hypothetical protein
MMLLGKSKNTVTYFFFMILVSTVNGQTGKSYKYDLSDLKTCYSVNNDGSVIIQYVADELNLESASVDSGKFYRLSVPGHVSSTETGLPEVPVYSRLITLPEGSDYRIKISDVHSKKIRPSGKIPGKLYPSQQSQIKAVQETKRHLSIDRKAYSHHGIISRDTVTIEPLGVLRGSKIANVYIRPVGYNPHSNLIEVITSMKIEISFEMNKASSKSASLLTLAFSEFLSNGIINSTNELIPDYTDKPAGMIILTDTAFRKQLQPFIRWKTQQGFRIKMLYKGAAFAGTTYQQLKDSISRVYNASTPDSPAPDYLLIVGDVTRIPYYGAGGSGNVTDMYYAEFDGNGDYIPEMYVGRLPVADTSELRRVLQKIIQYEKFLFTGASGFWDNALATTGSDAGYASYMNGQVKYSVTNYLINENKIKESHFYYPQTDLRKQKDSIIKLINNGTSFINYTGHGDQTGWLHVNIKVVDTALLKNKNMYPVIISNACRTATFSNNLSFGNRMVLEKNRGAAGFIGCSNDSFWDEDYYWAVGLGNITDNPVYAGKGLGIFDRLFHTHNEFPSEWYYTLGQINYAGNMSVSASTSSKKKYYWETYNIIGDPSMIPFIGRPDSFKVALPDTLPNGIKTLTLTSEPFSYVAVSHFDKLWDASFASSSGSVELSMPGVNNDSCLVVITGQNRYPLIKTIYFADINKRFINLNSTFINDSTGNANNKADFNENFYLGFSLSNLGQTDASGLYAKISTTSPWLTIERDSVMIGTLPGQSHMTMSDRLLLKVKSNPPDLEIATVDLILKETDSERNYRIDIPLHAPQLQILSVVMNDSLLGNGDFIADSGETLNLVFKILNKGTSDISGEMKVSSSTTGISILDSRVESGVLKFGEITEIIVTARISELLVTGDYVEFSASLDCDPFIINKDFSFRIGKLRETFESSSLSTFPWINNSPVPWIITSSDAFEGRLSARSGLISHNASTSMQMKIYYPAPDSLKFRYKVSSEPTYDFLSFVLNGKEIFKKSGETQWSTVSVAIPKGLNRLEWIYKKDQSVTKGQDCAWIDMIDFALEGAVNYIKKDLQVIKIVSPVIKDEYGQEVVTAKVVNTGKDVIEGFNLAYSINNRIPVKQYFKTRLNPDTDTATVSFSVPADLSKYGIFKMAVYGFGNQDDYLYNDTARIQLENTKISETLSVFPNPVIDRFSISVNSQTKDRINIIITGSSGKEFYSTTKDIVSGQNVFLIEDAELIPGVYYLNIRSSAINMTVPLIKIRSN